MTAETIFFTTFSLGKEKVVLLRR